MTDRSVMSLVPCHEGHREIVGPGDVVWWEEAGAWIPRAEGVHVHYTDTMASALRVRLTVDPITKELTLPELEALGWRPPLLAPGDDLPVGPNSPVDPLLRLGAALDRQLPDKGLELNRLLDTIADVLERRGFVIAHTSALKSSLPELTEEVAASMRRVGFDPDKWDDELSVVDARVRAIAADHMLIVGDNEARYLILFLWAMLTA